NLRRLVHDLRLALPEADRYLDLEGPALTWRADAPYTLDAAQFRVVAEQAATAPAVAEAVRRYPGDLLPHLYDEWLLPERARLRPGAPPAAGAAASPPTAAPPAAGVPRPAGTVTLLFTDIQGSTQLLHQLGDRYGAVLADHQRLVRAAFRAHRGHEVDSQGD